MIAKIIVGILLLGTAGAYFGIHTPEPSEMEVTDKYSDSLSQPGLVTHRISVAVSNVDTTTMKSIGKKLSKQFLATKHDSVAQQVVIYFYEKDKTEAFPEEQIARIEANNPSIREQAKQVNIAKNSYIFAAFSSTMVVMGGYPPEVFVKRDVMIPSGGRYRYKTLIEEQINKAKSQH